MPDSIAQPASDGCLRRRRHILCPSLPRGCLRPDHADQLSADPTVNSDTISDTRSIEVTATAKTISYRADFRRNAADAAPAAWFVSSLWMVRDGRWQNVFSQDTPVD